ncbi:unnamed protein product, partial [marine sediment metagenome]
MNKNLYDFRIQNLGKMDVPSPITVSHFTPDDKSIIYDISLKKYEGNRKTGTLPLSMEMAGPRKTIYFDPPKIRAGIVTCGGLCPGINDVIR